METNTDSPPISPKKQKIVTLFRVVGWAALWIQLGLAVATGLVLVFAIFGRNFSTETITGIGSGIFWAICAVIALCANVFLSFRYTRLAKHLKHPEQEIHPRKADAIRILRLAVAVGLVGLFLGLVGEGATMTVLIAKVVSQPSGITLTDPNRIVRALDVFVAVANLSSMVGNFLGVVAALGILNWL